MRKKVHSGYKVFLTAFFVIFVVYGGALLYPLIWAVINAGKTGTDYYNNSFNIQNYYLFENFKNAFTGISHNNVNLITMFFNSVWMSMLCVFANVGACSLTAYVMAKYRFPFKSGLYAIAIIIQIVPIIGTEAARYKFMYEIGMLNNPFLIWLSWASGFGFAFIVLYGFFKSISWSYAEAAFMDGCSNFQVFYKIMLPQAKPAILSLMILNFISAWNDFYTPLIYMKDYPTMSLGIYIFGTESRFAANSTTLLFAAIIIAMIPVLLIFAFAQKMIMSNVTAGGLKG